MHWKNINIKDYQYFLPENKIAKFPLKERDSSKLLYYHKGKIAHHVFKDLPNLLPDPSLLVSNNTKVIPARIIFHKASGAKIEVFLLDPISPSALHEETLASKGECIWKCMIGNAKKWKINTSLTIGDNHQLILEAYRFDHDLVKFQWNAPKSFSEIIQEVGQLPLPPYLKREAEAQDIPGYQTVYSMHEGAVAAPTAGLHFSKNVLETLQQKKIEFEQLTLHVSAGTFQPMKSGIEEHPMHNEQLIIPMKLIKKVRKNNQVIAIGTTSMRTLESLYWFGVRLEQQNKDFNIQKMEPYTHNTSSLSRDKSLDNVVQYMSENHLDQLVGNTEIFIFPGYEFKICTGLITNFHLPASTLILLVAAFVGKDWRLVYETALRNDYRFLSYGDSSLLLPGKNFFN